MPTEDHNQILDRLRNDDQSALQELFNTSYLPVCTTIKRFIQDHALVEDLAQEVFVRFWEKRHTLQITSSLHGYLRRMAINEALGYLRRNRLYTEDIDEQPDIDGKAPDVEKQLLHSELEGQIRAAIDKLPPRCRTVFQLSRYEELTYQEIADKMDISIKTVENQMGKALRVLREELQHYLNLVLIIGIGWDVWIMGYWDVWMFG
ncbi:MAG: RNA polymerase sigma-70 factor [Saprospiraceae bacterium]|nr:RNA polymerase sigma-70 factor [Lewinella sp.]